MPTLTQLVGGAFQDSEGNVLANGYLEFVLNQDSSVTGVGNVGAGVKIRIQLDSDGNVASSTSTPSAANQSIWGNDNLVPANTYYRVTGFTLEGQAAWGPNNQQVVGSSPFDVGTWVPNSVFSWTPPLQQILPSYTVALLPTGIDGMLAYASDGRKVGEGSGSGTGVPVYFSDTEWRVYSTDDPVQD